MFASFSETFPNVRSLSIEFYTKLPYSKSTIRRSKVLVLLGAMCEHSEFRKLTIPEQDTMIKGIEIGCLNKVVDKAIEDNIPQSWTSHQFIYRYNSLVSELVESLLQSDSVLIELLEGRVKPDFVSELPYETLFPDLKNQIKYAEERKKQIIVNKTTSLFECPQCGKKEAHFQEVQVRSGDEGKDLQLICVFCGYEWFARN